MPRHRGVDGQLQDHARSRDDGNPVWWQVECCCHPHVIVDSHDVDWPSECKRVGTGATHQEAPVSDAPDAGQSLAKRSRIGSLDRPLTRIDPDRLHSGDGRGNGRRPEGASAAQGGENRLPHRRLVGSNEHHVAIDHLYPDIGRVWHRFQGEVE